MKKQSVLVKIWDILWPLFIYLIAQNVITLIGALILQFFENSEELMNQYAVAFLLISALLCIPIYYKMYRKDREAAKEEKRNVPMENKDYIAIILSGAALALAMNNIISLTPLPIIFTGYEDTSEMLFGGGLLLQILSAGIFACIVEELSMRGVAYLRLKKCWGKKKAILFSAIIFGIYHMNVVQAVYAFVLGLFFAWLYDRYDTLWAPITAHMSANLFIILLSGSSIAMKVMSNMVGFCLVTCISLLVFQYGWRFMKETNPLVELEFIEKEPDTLKKLTEEYKEQEREDKLQ